MRCSAEDMSSGKKCFHRCVMIRLNCVARRTDVEATATRGVTKGTCTTMLQCADVRLYYDINSTAWRSDRASDDNWKRGKGVGEIVGISFRENMSLSAPWEQVPDGTFLATDKVNLMFLCPCYGTPKDGT